MVTTRACDRSEPRSAPEPEKNPSLEGIDHRIKYCLAFFVVDSLLTFWCFSELAEYHNIHPSELLSPFHYSFTRSPLEFVLLWIIRSAVVHTFIYGCVSRTMVKMLSWESTRIVFEMSSVALALFKLLAFDEVLPALQVRGSWMLVLWSCVSVHFMAKYLEMECPLEEEEEENENQDDEVDDDEINNYRKFSNMRNYRKLTWDEFRILIGYSLAEWKWISIGAFLTFFSTSITMSIPSQRADLLSSIMNQSEYSNLYWPIIHMTLIQIFSYIVSKILTEFQSRAAEKIILRVKTDLFKSLVHQDISFFDKNNYGTVQMWLGSDCSNFGYIASQICKIGVMISLSWHFTVVYIIALSITRVFDNFRYSYAILNRHAVEQIRIDAGQISHEVFSTMQNVRAFGTEKRETRRYTANLEEALKLRKSSIVYDLLTGEIPSEFINAARLIGVLAYAAHLIQKGTYSPALFASFYALQRESKGSLDNIFYLFSNPFDFSYCGNALRLLAMKPKVKCDGELKPEIKGKFVLEDLSFNYANRVDIPVLKDFHLEISAGETIALVGHSGAGKSTIVSLLEHFYEPETGTISIDGVPIKDIDNEYYHKQVALVAQEPILYSKSIRENITYGFEEATDEQITEAAKMANAHNFIMDFPSGYNTMCGERGVRMSGGQKQRIAIARALVRNPSVLILDEATSALDAESEAAVQEANHQRTHTGEKPFKCHECGACFGQSSHLKTHQIMHSGERPFKCGNCDASFAQSGNLKIHLRVHTGEKPYKCAECGKDFSLSSTFMVHMRTHTGEKPFTCEICKKAFSESSHKIDHMKRVHYGTKNHKCDECGKMFVLHSELKSHQRVHSGERPYECQESFATFSYSYHRNDHMRLHIGEAFKCYQCKKDFAQRAAFMAHVKIHTIGKAFKCDHCSKTFSVRGSLQKHIRNLHAKHNSSE